MTPAGGRGNSVVVVVDPYSTGCCIVKEVLKRGYDVIAVWSRICSEDMKKHIPSSCSDLVYYDEVSEKTTIAETVVAVQQAATPLDIIACIYGGDTGVLLTDALSERLGVRTNGTGILNRRDKKVQQELIKSAGLRSVRQVSGKKFSDVELFLKAESYPVVVKPVESAGSDGVELCHSFNDAKKHFHLLMNSQRKAGSSDAAVLCQEFLKGKEYVVDHVSRDGVHKTVMIWVYDKREVNGAAFVYFGLLPVDSEAPEAKVLIPYVRGVLDAIEFRNGPSHGEVIITADGPCLVEMNCRAHGGDGNWQPLVRALTGGYCQVDVSIDAYLDEDRFSNVPDRTPSPFKSWGQEVTLVSFSRGRVKTTPGFDVIKKLPSFVCLETRVDVGSEVEYTVDLFTDIGSVILVHQREEVAKRDVKFIRYMEEINAFFQYESSKKENRNGAKCDVFDSFSEAKVSENELHTGIFSSKDLSLVRRFSDAQPEVSSIVKRRTEVAQTTEGIFAVDPYCSVY